MKVKDLIKFLHDEELISINQRCGHYCELYVGTVGELNDDEILNSNIKDEKDAIHVEEHLRVEGPLNNGWALFISLEES